MTIVVAIDSKRGIGKNGKLLCRIPEDIERFVSITWGGTVVMGHRTFTEIGKPLEGRRNIIFTKEKFPCDQDIIQVCSYEEFLQAMKGESMNTCYIIGGAQLYKEFIDKVDTLFVTRFDKDFGADKFFPEFENTFVPTGNGDWREDKQEKLFYRFEVWQRPKNPEPIKKIKKTRKSKEKKYDSKEDKQIKNNKESK